MRYVSWCVDTNPCSGKTFHYPTPLLQPEAKQPEGTNLLNSAAFHGLASPDNLVTQVEALLRSRQSSNAETKPLLIWEPLPSSCNSVNLDTHLQACKCVNVFSPNHLELAALLSESENCTDAVGRVEIEAYSQKLLDLLDQETNTSLIIVIRAAEHSCLILPRSCQVFWLPSVYQLAPSKIVDFTGAGNAFLRALGMLLQSNGNIKEAAIHGTITASFALWQVGLPVLGSAIVDGQDAET